VQTAFGKSLQIRLLFTNLNEPITEQEFVPFSVITSPPSLPHGMDSSDFDDRCSSGDGDVNAFVSSLNGRLSV
jgi:hypothetical protein